MSVRVLTKVVTTLPAEMSAADRSKWNRPVAVVSFYRLLNVSRFPWAAPAMVVRWLVSAVVTLGKWDSCKSAANAAVATWHR